MLVFGGGQCLGMWDMWEIWGTHTPDVLSLEN